MIRSNSLARPLPTLLAVILTVVFASIAAAQTPPVPAYEDHALLSLPVMEPPLLDSFWTYGFDVVRVHDDFTMEVVAVEREAKILTKKFGAKVLIPNCEEYNREIIGADKPMGGFRTYSEILEEADSLVNLYPDLALLDTIGFSLEGRPIIAMKISDNPTVDEDEPEVQFNGLIHAREVITYEILLYTAKQLLTFYPLPDIQPLVDNNEIWFIFVVNPDGLAYNELTNPDGGGMWRKNRRDNGDGTFGIDLNRNFGYGWGYNNIGSSPDGSTEIYRGTGPFSEPESQVLRNFFNAHDFCASIHYHAYGDFMNIPFNFFNTPVFVDHFQQIPTAVQMQNLAQCGLSYGYFSNTGPNGTSYDWSYGDQTEKRKCFSWLVEVGDWFWPSLDAVPRLLTRYHSMNIHLLENLAQFHETPSRSVGTTVYAYDTSAAYYEADFTDTVVFHNIDPTRNLTFDFSYVFGSEHTDWFEMTPVVEQLLPGDSIGIELRLSPQGIESVSPGWRVPAYIELHVTDSTAPETDTLVFSVFMQALDADVDDDGVVDPLDNCVSTANPSQEDLDQDGVGDACDDECCIAGVRGDILGDGVPGEVSIDISDLVYLVAYMFQSGPAAICPGEVDIDGSGTGPDIADLVYLVSFMFKDGPPPAECL